MAIRDFKDRIPNGEIVTCYHKTISNNLAKIPIITRCKNDPLYYIVFSNNKKVKLHRKYLEKF